MHRYPVCPSDDCLCPTASRARCRVFERRTLPETSNKLAPLSHFPPKLLTLSKGKTSDHFPEASSGIETTPQRFGRRLILPFKTVQSRPFPAEADLSLIFHECPAASRAISAEDLWRSSREGRAARTMPFAPMSHKASFSPFSVSFAAEESARESKGRAEEIQQ